VEYTVLVPRDAFVILRSVQGTLHAQGLTIDLILEGATAAVEMTDIVDAYVQVKTFSGPITLTDIRNSRLNVFSVSGNERRVLTRKSLRARATLSTDPVLAKLLQPHECGPFRGAKAENLRRTA
jgi:hypothetical protein